MLAPQAMIHLAMVGVGRVDQLMQWKCEAPPSARPCVGGS